MTIKLLRAAAAPLLAAALAGCSTYGSISRDRELYGQLGAKAGIKAIVDGLFDAALADVRIQQTFADKDVPRIKEQVALQICALTGGPCTYGGKSMAEIHHGLDISAGEFNAFVEDLQKSMNAQSVPLGAQNKLLALLAPMRREMLYR